MLPRGTDLHLEFSGTFRACHVDPVMSGSVDATIEVFQKSEVAGKKIFDDFWVYLRQVAQSRDHS